MANNLMFWQFKKKKIHELANLTKRWNMMAHFKARINCFKAPLLFVIKSSKPSASNLPPHSSSGFVRADQAPTSCLYSAVHALLLRYPPRPSLS